MILFTVNEMIEECGFSDFKVIAGEGGLSNEVSSVTVFDAPDAWNWLKGGEFVITTGYFINNDSRVFEDLIINIKANKMAGIGIKVDRFIHKVPNSVIDKANELGIPIIYIPNHYAFIEIINPVLTKIINDQADRLKRSEMIRKSFTQLVIDGGDLKDILVTLKRITGFESAYADIYFNTFIFESEDLNFVNTIKSMDFISFQEHKFFEISYNKYIFGYLIINVKGKIEQLEEAAIEHAITVLKLYIQRKISNTQIEMRYRDEFVRDLITKNIRSVEEVKKRAKIFGWEFNSKIVVLMFDIDNYKSEYFKMNHKKDNLNLEMTREKIFRIVIEQIKSEFRQPVYTTLSDSITFILNVNNTDKLKKRISKLCSEVLIKVKNGTGFTLTIGIGSVMGEIMLAKESYTEAFRVVKISRLAKKTNHYKFYNEAGLYKLYYDVSLTAFGEEFCSENLDRLIEHDKNNNTYLFKTLNCLVENEWNLKETANRMYVHYNTIKYRYKKLCEILEIDFHSFEQKMKYTFSIKIYNILHQ